MSSKPSGRRRFLKGGTAALAGFTVGAIQPADAQAPGTPAPHAHPASGGKDVVAYGERSRFVTTVRKPDREARTPFGVDQLHALTPLQDQQGIITPSSLHFVAAHGGMDIPDIDPREHRLMIHGMVDRPLVFTMEELKRFPSVSRIYYVECNGNQPGRRHKTVQESHGKTSCSEWTGVPLALLLKEAGVKQGAKFILSEAADGVKSNKSLPLAKAMADTIVAYAQNGEPVRPQQGFPLRLLPPGFEGQDNIKWLHRIEVVDQVYVTYNEISRVTTNPKTPKSPWFTVFEQGPKSVITSPSGGQQLQGRGMYEITGLAWSGGGAIRRVEVSVDGGRTWKDATVDGPAHRMAHTRFHYQWKWDGQAAELQSRCTDELNQVQPTRAAFRKFWGFAPDDPSESGAGLGHVNYIQPWRVAPDGSVLNGLA